MSVTKDGKVLHVPPNGRIDSATHLPHTLHPHHLGSLSHHLHRTHFSSGKSDFAGAGPFLGVLQSPGRSPDENRQAARKSRHLFLLLLLDRSP